MEINNNINSPYLHASEDKSDKFIDKNNGNDEKMIKMHGSQIINSSAMDAKGSLLCDENFSEKSRVDSSNNNKDIIIMEVMSDKCEKSHNGSVTQAIDIKPPIHNEIVIRNDSKKIESKDVEVIIEAKGSSFNSESNFIFNLFL